MLLFSSVSRPTPTNPASTGVHDGAQGSKYSKSSKPRLLSALRNWYRGHDEMSYSADERVAADIERTTSSMLNQRLVGLPFPQF